MNTTKRLYLKRKNAKHVRHDRRLNREPDLQEHPEENKTLGELFEKLYFHEIQSRENLSQRLQIPLAVLVALAGILGQMLQNMERSQPGSWFAAFWTAVAIASALLAISVFWFGRAQWGHRYKYLPTPEELEDYRNQCVDLYKEYPNKKRLVDDAIDAAIYERYVECTPRNSNVNAQKSEDIAWLNRVLAGGAVFKFLSFLCFHFGELDKKYHEVKVVEPIEMKGPVNGNQTTTAAAAASAGNSRGTKTTTASTADSNETPKVSHDKRKEKGGSAPAGS